MKFNLTFKQVDIIIEALGAERRYYQKELNNTDTSDLEEYKSMLKEKIEQIESLIEIMKKTEKTYRVELDDDNFKIFTATNSAEAERIGADIAEELGSGYCLVEEVAE